jgi:hypothetical protein
MSTLRSKLIRLAASAPKASPLRREVLAVLASTPKEARGGDWETVVSNDKVRIQSQDHPDNLLQIQELPGKPFKQKLRRRTYTTFQFVHHIKPGHDFLMTNLLTHAKLTSSMSFDQAVAAMDKALDDAKKETLKNEAFKEYGKSHPGIYPEIKEEDFKQLRFPASAFYDEDVSFLQVEPADYKPVSFAGKDFSGTSEWTKFRFYADKDDDKFMREVEGMQAFYQSTSPGGARKLFQVLKANPDAVKGMTKSDFTDMLQKLKIGYDYTPTVWR